MMKAKNGFSLVEVNLAIFVISIGLLTLFALFPAGLKEGEAGHADTQTSLFADYVLATIRSEAVAISASDWKTFSYSRIIPTSPDDPTDINEGGSRPIAVEFPDGSGLYVRYYLDIASRDEDGRIIYGVRLWVTSGQYGTNNLKTFRDSADMYYTELFFSGMP